jgi:hypothetical protein
VKTHPWLAATVVALLASPCRADDPSPGSSACLASFEAAQTHRKEGQLLAAEKELLICGQATCPTVVRSKCIEWRDEVAEIVPSIVVTVTDAAGRDTSAAEVLVNGELVRDRLDGRPIRLDPGSHELRVRHGSEPDHVQQLVLAEGQRNREVAVSFAEAKATTAEDGGDLSPLLFVGAGVTGLGVIVGAITGGLALSKGADFEDACPDKTRCDASQSEAYDEGLVLSHVSTVSFAVAGAGAVLGVVGLIISDWSGGDVEVAVGLGGAWVGGRF